MSIWRCFELKKFILLVSFICLTACSNELHSIYGKISSIEEDRIHVGCSDLKPNSKDDIGYSCTIKITDETIIKTQAGDVLTFDELTINHMVSVYFEEPITLDAVSERQSLEANEITVFEN